MKIVELTAFLVRIPLRKAITHASRSRKETDNVVVRCVLENGSIGYGEGLPREYVTGDSAESAIELLKKSDLASQLPPCKNFADLLEVAESLRLAAIPGDDRDCQGNAARCALELAILDAYGRAFGEPLSNVAKVLTPELYDFKSWVRYSGAITSAKGMKARLAAWKMWIYGFKQLKIKVGIEGQDDVARLRSIRKRSGKKMDLRIDANEAWSASSAVERIAELEPFGITSVEQPIPHAEVDALCITARRSRRRSCSMNHCAAKSMQNEAFRMAGAICSTFAYRNAADLSLRFDSRKWQKKRAWATSSAAWSVNPQSSRQRAGISHAA